MSDLPDNDLGRLLGSWQVPPLADDFAARVAAEAIRPDRPRLPPASAPRRTGRRWTRRGVWTGIVAFNLVLASAVAAAFGGGALDFAPIHRVASRMIEHIVPHRTHRLVPVNRRVEALPRTNEVSRHQQSAFLPVPTAFGPRIAAPSFPARLAPGSSARPHPALRFKVPDKLRAALRSHIRRQTPFGGVSGLHKPPADRDGARHRSEDKMNPFFHMQRGKDSVRFGHVRPRFEGGGGRFEQPFGRWRNGNEPGERWHGGRLRGPRWRDRGGFGRRSLRVGGHRGPRRRY